MNSNYLYLITQYFKRSYFALDGLWFAIVEKHFSQKDALKIDEEVWRVLPKIQAREVRRLLDLQEDTLQNFLCALRVKLDAEGYQYREKLRNKDLYLSITRCPWYEILKKAQREHLAPNTICQIDLQGWANEFHLQKSVAVNSRICGGESMCEILFKK